ncbi:hypothetical protein ACFL0Q_06335, partial [Thermodesulfobacteriota bacterium]
AKGQVKALVLMRADFDMIRSVCSELDEAARDLASTRMDELGKHRESHMQETLEWVRGAAEALRKGKEMPSPREVKRLREEHTGAMLGIWLGILLDSIPESFVIGSSFLALLAAKTAAGATVSFANVIPYTLIAGLFLSNFPEAMSSSVLMASSVCFQP